jgi:ribosomal protein L11 methyltransferase
MTYIAYNFIVSPLVPGSEILIAELSEIGFDSFAETNSGITAYIKSHNILL